MKGYGPYNRVAIISDIIFPLRNAGIPIVHAVGSQLHNSGALCHIGVTFCGLFARGALDSSLEQRIQTLLPTFTTQFSLNLPTWCVPHPSLAPTLRTAEQVAHGGVDLETSVELSEEAWEAGCRIGKNDDEVI